jgi:hypothetical protein
MHGVGVQYCRSWKDIAQPSELDGAWPPSERTWTDVGCARVAEGSMSAPERDPARLTKRKGSPRVLAFAQWGDVSEYVLAPGGDFEEQGATWTLTGSAGAVEGNEPFHVGAPTDHLALSLPAHGSATTAQMCIGIEHRTLRLFAKASRRAGALRVEVLYAGRARTLGTIEAATGWAPSDVLPTIVNELAPAHGNAINVAFRFTPRGAADWTIDDVYVDPFRSR